MSTPMIGMNAIFGLGEEGTWGSAGTIDHWLPVMGHNFEPTEEIVPVPFLGVSNNQTYHNYRDSVVVAKNLGGELTTCAMYDDKAFLLLLKHAMGAVGTSGPVSTQYTHTFSLDTDGVVGLTGKAVMGSQVSKRSEQYTGLRVNTLDLSVDAAGWMTARAGMIGKDTGGLTTLSGTPAFAVSEQVLGAHGSVATFNAHTANVRSFRLSVNNNLTRRPYLGSFFTDAPVPGGFASIMWELTIPWEASDLYDDFIALVKSALVMTFTGTGDNLMTINLNNSRILGVSKPVDRAGELTMSIRGQAFDLPGTNQALGIVVKNSNSAAI